MSNNSDKSMILHPQSQKIILKCCFTFNYVQGISTHECSCSCRQETLARPGAAIIGSWELPNMGSQSECSSSEGTLCVPYQ